MRTGAPPIEVVVIDAYGAEGMAAVKAGGGPTIVEQPADADVATMPEAAIARRAPDHILPLRPAHPLGDPA